jgi:4-hydroxy-tetrahydrodipicolinate synthase
VGGGGGIFVFTHLVGQRVRELITRFHQGDLVGARAVEAELKPVIDALAIDTNPIPVKAAMVIAGHDVGIPRLPLVDATDPQKAELRAVLERLGVLQAAQV